MKNSHIMQCTELNNNRHKLLYDSVRVIPLDKKILFVINNTQCGQMLIITFAEGVIYY